MALSYANIFMGKLVKQIISTSLSKPLSQFRFIDDVDMKWIESQQKLDAFIRHANNAHQSIKFTYEISDSKISFLDTTTSIKDGVISTDLYCKPTDKHQYLSPQSCHPKHCTKSIPYSQISEKSGVAPLRRLSRNGYRNFADFLPNEVIRNGTQIRGLSVLAITATMTCYNTKRKGVAKQFHLC